MGEEFLTIGYFRDSVMPIDTIRFQNINVGGICDTGSYYYLDSVFVMDSISYVGFAEYNMQQCQNQNYFFEILSSLNNELLIMESFELMEYKLTITNYLGQEVFKKSSLQSVGWNGRNNIGNYCNSGMYPYQLTYKEKILKRGYIQLLINN